MKDHLALYSSNCLKCSLLVHGASVAWPCTAESGNTDCPAQEVQLVVVGPARYAARKVLEARAKGNLGLESRLLAKVAARGPAFVQKFNQFLSEAET